MRSGPIAYFAGNPIAANLLMAFFIVGGLIAGRNLPVQSYPDLDLRSVSVTVISPGSSPREVEEDIVRRVEQNVVGLPGVERVVATAYEGRGEIRAELATFANADAVLDDVQSAVDRIENFPPLTAEQPEVQYDRLDIEVMTLAVSSASATEDELRRAAEDLRVHLLELPSVSQVALLGTRDREITIELSEEEMRRHSLTILQISNAVERASLNLTFGELRTDSGGLVLHTVAKRQTGEEFEDIPLIARMDGTMLTLGDVADIRDGFVDEDIIARVDGDPAVFVRVDAAEQQSIVAMGEEIRNSLAGYSPPAGIAVEMWNDRAGDAVERISLIVQNAVIGIILVFICLIVFFDLRVAVWITVGIPLSFLGSLIFFAPTGMTLNLGTIFAFFLMVGIVVDDAVVVGESIAAERERGKGALEAAVSGAQAMVGPITIGAVTTILAFLPFLFVTPIRVQIVSVFPYVAFFVLIVSLAEAFFILPSHLSHERNWSVPPLSDFQARVRKRLAAMRDNIVVPAVSWSVQRVWVAPTCGAVLVVFALVLMRSEAVQVVYFDDMINASDDLQVDLTLPVGTPFATTLATAERFVDAAQRINGQSAGTPIESISVMAGSFFAPPNQALARINSHQASVVVHLNDRPERQASIQEVQRQVRQNVGDVSYLGNVRYYTGVTRPVSGIAYAVKHDDPGILRQAANDLVAGMQDVPGVYAVANSQALGKRHLEIELTPEGHAAGLTTGSIGAQLRSNFHGAVVQRLQRGADEIKVVVRYPEEQRQSRRELANERIFRPGGVGEIPLSTVANLVERRELSTLTSIDGQQAARVTGEADPAVMTPLQARRQVNQDLIPDLLAMYPGLVIEPDGSAREESSMLDTLRVLIPLVMIAMYVLIAAFLRSYWKPLIAVVGVPIAFAGSVFGHWILGWDYGFMSLFGLIGVAGVIVNDALVLMDRYNTLRRENEMLPAIAAASAATRHRFRAVFLTSLTTVLALAPLLYERSDVLMFLVPFVVSMLGGLIFSGLFILFLLPSLVMIAEAGRE